jgi:hypothetical protein
MLLSGEEKGDKSPLDSVFVKGESAEECSQDITLDPTKEKKLWRKLDRHLMPILSVLFLLSFL